MLKQPSNSPDLCCSASQRLQDLCSFHRKVQRGGSFHAAASLSPDAAAHIRRWGKHLTPTWSSSAALVRGRLDLGATVQQHLHSWILNDMSISLRGDRQAAWREWSCQNRRSTRVFMWGTAAASLTPEWGRCSRLNNNHRLFVLSW